MGFSGLHPGIHFMYYALLLFCVMYFNQPVFLAIGFIGLLFAAGFVVKARSAVINMVLLILAAVYALFYGTYNHFGVTVIGNGIKGNRITLEALVYGFVIGIKAAMVIMTFECIHRILTKEKLVYLTGRVCPVFSMYFSILLRLIPELGKRWKIIDAARSGIGLGKGQGAVIRRISNVFKYIQLLTGWLIEYLGEEADAMRAKGFTLKKRSAFAIYRFDKRDRSIVILIAFMMSGIFMAVMLGQTRAIYSPIIYSCPNGRLTYLFYLIYGIFVLFPAVFEACNQISYRRKTEKI